MSPSEQNCTSVQNQEHDWRLSRERCPAFIPVCIPAAWGTGIKYVYRYMSGRVLLQHPTSNKSQRRRQTGTMKGCDDVTSPPPHPGLSFIFYLIFSSPSLPLFLSSFLVVLSCLVKKFNLPAESRTFNSPVQLATVYRDSHHKTKTLVRKQNKKKKQTPWSESASELYRPIDRRLSAKWLPTFADKGCHVVSVTDPYGRILGFLDRSRYFSIK
jgi:hypothetical protein